MYVGTLYQYTLTSTEGTTTKLTGFYEKPEEWGAVIQRELTRAQFPATLSVLRAGQECRFGDLTVTREQVTSGKRSVRWEELEGVSVNQGLVFIKRSGKWMSWSKTPVKNIANFFVFLAIADYMLGAEGAQAHQPLSH